MNLKTSRAGETRRTGAGPEFVRTHESLAAAATDAGALPCMRIVIGGGFIITLLVTIDIIAVSLSGPARGP